MKEGYIIRNHSRNKNYQFWQYGNHAVEIYTKEFMWSKLDYIHLNQLRKVPPAPQSLQLRKVSRLSQLRKVS